MNFNFDIHNCMIWIELYVGISLNFLQTKYGMTFKDSQESTKQLCIFLLKISKVNKIGGVDSLDLFYVDVLFTVDFQDYPKFTMFMV